MKRTLAFVLALAMIVPALVACNPTNQPTTDPIIASPTREAESSLPADLKFNGETVMIITQENGLFREKTTGDPVNDLTLNRTAKVEKLLNVKLKFKSTYSGDYASGEAVDIATQSILSGLDEYQIVEDHINKLGTSVADGSYSDLLSGRFKYFDPTKEWYVQEILDAGSIAGKAYITTGDLTLTGIKRLSVVLFNKDLAEQYGVQDNVYEIVKAGDWTLDKMLDIISGVYTDVTGNGKTIDDVFGLKMNDNDSLDGFYGAFGMEMIRKDENDIPYIYMDQTNNLRFTEVTKKVDELMRENQYVYCLDSEWMQANDPDFDQEAQFAEDTAMFFITPMNEVSKEVIRNMKSEYILMPLPKYDSAQTDYQTFASPMGFAFPKTVQQPELVSAVFEALSYDSYCNVAPAYYNRILKGQYMQNPESTELIDIVTSKIRIGFEWIYLFPLDRMPTNSFRYLLRYNTRKFGSYWRSEQRGYEKHLADLVDTIQKDS